jgi:hypothetical protein
MKFKEPKNTETLHWTLHAKAKMRFYAISERMVKRALIRPKRTEHGVAPHTSACMIPYGKPQKGKRQPYTGEVWIMYQKVKPKVEGRRSGVRVISAWRYPGVSPVRGKIPIPLDILEELDI